MAITITAQTKQPAEPSRASGLLAALAAPPSPLARLIERLQQGGAHALHEAVPAARPALLAAIYRVLGGQICAIVPTTDGAERAFADLLYYLEEEEPRSVRLLRAREEATGAIESPSERSARIELLADLADGKPGITLVPLAALRQYLPAPARFCGDRFVLRADEAPGWERTLARIAELGYERADVVSAAGEFAVRGGIIDLFAATAGAPVRIEFFGEAIESIRSFDLATQRSTGSCERIEIAPWNASPLDDRANVLDYLHARALLVLDEPGTLARLERAMDDEREREANLLAQAAQAEIDEPPIENTFEARAQLADLAPKLARRRVLIFPATIESAQETPWLMPVVSSVVLEARPAEHFNRKLEWFTQSLREWAGAGERVLLVSSGAGRTGDVVRASGVQVATAGQAGIFVDHGNIEAGFSVPALRLRVLGDREIYGQPPKRVKIRAVKEGVPVTLADLKIGDYVVHAVHGIGQYFGLRTETILGATQDYLELHYAGTDRMLVPVTQMHQVTKYSASEGGSPRLSKMGGADWARTKTRVSESLAKIADGLVALYAERELAKGHAFGQDTAWQAELEEAFPYDETPDQLRAIVETKRDMERARPMDRVVCGDVGYGKTEVAIRAAFKAVADKKQVAILVPTTLLADQHYRNFSARFAGFPMRIEELSRFKSKKDQKSIVADLALGKIDIVIGTHRLLQKDIAFADLGLIVVDEEQRFGVMHKERLKQLRASVDVLTLSATPIPRTLHMSLMGVRDLSLIQTAPKNRMSIKTLVVPSGDAVVQRAISAEIDRGGQIYYLHNRIESIYAVRNALEALVPRARIAVGHGQMHEHEIEPIMQHFIDGEIDVLVATTIIENGIDIPNVNTIIVNDADKFGLAQLYQLRGRVGRSNHQAYAYLLYQGHKSLTEEAQARLEAIREFTHLGSGLQIAMRDLEIRGAGNLLGSAQSGFIATVGFDTYCQLLADAIAERKGLGEALEERREAVIDVKVDAYVPTEYVPQVSQKIAIYQQLAKSRTQDEVHEIAAGVRDRFGPLPQPLENLVELTKLRTIALAKHVTRVVVEERRLTLGVGSGFALQPSAIPQFQSLTKNRFRFAEGKVLVDLPALPAGEAPERRWMPLLRGLLEAM